VSGGSCNNTVVNVSYTMTWIGANITRVDAVITVADVPLTDSVTIGTGKTQQNDVYLTLIWAVIAKASIHCVTPRVPALLPQQSAS